MKNNNISRVKVVDPIAEKIALLQGTFTEYQKRDIESNARYTWSNWARQTGKSHGKSLKRIIRGIKRNQNQIFLSASANQSRELMLKAQMHLRTLGMLMEIVEVPFRDDEKITQLEIALPGTDGKRIIGLPANPRTARGFTGDLFLDEFAMHQNSRKIYSSAFPSVTRSRGEVDVSSTPKGKDMFYEIGNKEDFHRETLTIYDAVEQGLDIDIEELRKGMIYEADWRQEFMCEFVDEMYALLTHDMINRCENGLLPYELDLNALHAHTGELYVGVDVGRTHDLTVIWVLERIGDRFITVGLIELHNTKFAAQREILYNVLSAPGIRRAVMDDSGLGMQLAEEAVDQFGEHMVEPFRFTNKSKELIAMGLRNKFDDRLIEIPVNNLLRDDLHGVQRDITPAGNVRFSANRENGSHSDRFWAAALSLYGGTDYSGPIECHTGGGTRETNVPTGSARGRMYN